MNASTQRRASKWARTHAPSEQWRQRLLSSCLSRLRKSRHAEQDAVRHNKLRALVSEEYHNNKPTCTTDNRNSDDDDEINDLFELLQEIESAQRDQLESILHSLQQHDDQHIDELSAFSDSVSASPDAAVLCPVCTAAHLRFLNGYLVCANTHPQQASASASACGFRLNCGTKDGVDLDMVRRQLDARFESHAQSECHGKLQFAVRAESFGEFLWAGCADCGHTSIIC